MEFKNENLFMKNFVKLLNTKRDSVVSMKERVIKLLFNELPQPQGALEFPS